MFQSTELHAQSAAQKFGIGLLVGGSRLYGDVTNIRASLASGVIFRYKLHPNFAVSVNANYGKLSSAVNAFDTHIFNALFSGSLFLFPKSPYRPFVSLGLSAFHYSTRDGNGRQLMDFNGRPIKGWNGALQFGLGFELFNGANWAFNTMGYYLNTSVDELDGIARGKKDGFAQGFVSLVYYFDQKPKHEESGSAFRGRHANRIVIEEVRRTNPASGNTLELFKRSIAFEHNSAEITADSKWHLMKIYRYLIANPDEKIELLGSKIESACDPNIKALIYSRAVSIKKYLVELGIAPNRIIITTPPL